MSMVYLRLGSGHPSRQCPIRHPCCTPFRRSRILLCEYLVSHLHHPPRLSPIRPKGESGEYCLTFYAGSFFLVCCPVVSASWSADRTRVASDETLTSSTVSTRQTTEDGLRDAYHCDDGEVQPHEWKQYGYWACPSVDGVPCSNSRASILLFYSVDGSMTESSCK